MCLAFQTSKSSFLQEINLQTTGVYFGQSEFGIKNAAIDGLIAF